MYSESRMNSLVKCRGFQVVTVIISTLSPLVAPIEASKESTLNTGGLVRGQMNLLECENRI